MCSFDQSFGHIFFVFLFVAKPMLEFLENMMFFRIVLKSWNYNYLSRRKVFFFRGTGSGGEALLARLLRQLTFVSTQ